MVERVYWAAVVVPVTLNSKCPHLAPAEARGAEAEAAFPKTGKAELEREASQLLEGDEAT